MLLVEMNTDYHQITANFMTDPCPEGIGRVASTARVDLLAAAVRNHVVMQSCVPVVVVVHSTAFPLISRREGDGELF